MAGERLLWDDIICPICLNSPHNPVLLQCSSYEKGCRPFICDTDHLHSNCLDRYKEANGMPTAGLKSLDSKPMCPLCRGEVSGWKVVDEAREHLDVKIRCCEGENCSFTGVYKELLKHAKIEHPDACPSRIEPARKRDWENIQRSSELIDVLTHIHSEIPNGIIFGDYVVEYEEEENDVEDVHGDGGRWWRSCIFFQIFGSFMTCRDRRSRPRDSESRRHRDEGHISSGEDALDDNADDGDGEFTGSGELSRERSAGQHSSRRHLSRSNNN